ncbi:MAG: hypothetical protein JXB32_03275 [Deltaproteobacteria bacterium]|nr:hypothetical protein [Deltaproteobacteria bacterium]
MRARVILPLLLAGILGCPSEIPPPPPPPPPPLPPCEALLAGRAARVEPAPVGIPQAEVATLGTVQDRRFGLGLSGRDFWYETDEGTMHAAFDGPDLPIGARFLPIVDWNLSARDEPTVIPALLTEGHGEACLFDGREPIALQDAAGLDAAPDADALGATLALRYLKTCPASPDECVVYGTPDAVAAARDPSEPPGGFYLRAPEAAEAPEDLTYEKATLPERAEPGTSPTVYRLVKSGNTRGFSVEVERATATDGPEQHNWARLFLKKGRNRVHAFDIDLRDANAYLVAHLHADGDRLLLWVAWPQPGLTLSVHEKRRAARQGEPLVVSLSPYYDLGIHGIDGVGVFPVPDGETVGLAQWDPNVDRAVFYATPDAEPEWLDVDLPASFDPDSDWARYFTRTDGTLVPTFEPE